MVTIENIKKWLFDYNEYELLAREHYEKTHTFLPDECIPINMRHGNPLLLNDLIQVNQNIHPSSAFFAQNRKTFSEEHYFFSDNDIFMKKHPRFTQSPVHDHQFFEICYILQGTCTQKIFSHNETYTLSLSTGDFLFIPPYQKHQISVPSDALALNMGIRSTTFADNFLHNIPLTSVIGTFFSTYLTHEENKALYMLFHTGKENPLSDYADLLAVTYANFDDFTKNLLNLHLGIMFLKLLKNYSKHVEVVSDKVKVSNIPDIILYMEKHYANTSVKCIAEHFEYSPDYLNKLYREATSQTLSDTLLKIKMQHAVRYLSEGLPVMEIAPLVGYADTTNFIRNFKKFYQMTPKQYQAMLKQREQAQLLY